MYAVTAASGNTGSVVARELLNRGHKVRVIGRSAKRLQPLVDEGAEAHVLDLTDKEKLAEAFEGVEAVYLVLPPNMEAENFMEYASEIIHSYKHAIEKAGVKKGVFLSSMGAQHMEGTGFIRGLRMAEDTLKEIDDFDLLSIRAAFFMENHLWSADAVKEHGVNAAFISPDVKIAHIATRDIGNYAAGRLDTQDFDGFQVQELHGSGDYSMRDVTGAIGTKIGKPDLEYLQVKEDQYREMMLSMGASENAVDEYMELITGLNAERVKPEEERREDTTTDTTLDEFAEMFKGYYERS